jgi:hypothetical protein
MARENGHSSGFGIKIGGKPTNFDAILYNRFLRTPWTFFPLLKSMDQATLLAWLLNWRAYLESQNFELGDSFYVEKGFLRQALWMSLPRQSKTLERLAKKGYLRYREDRHRQRPRWTIFLKRRKLLTDFQQSARRTAIKSR